MTYLCFYFVISKRIKLLFLPSNVVLFKDLRHGNLLFKKWQYQNDIRCIWSKGMTQREPHPALALARYHKRLTPHLLGLKTASECQTEKKKKEQTSSWNKTQTSERLVSCPRLSTKCISRAARMTTQVFKSQPQCDALWYRLNIEARTDPRGYQSWR